MKNIIIALAVLCGHSVLANVVVPGQFLANTPQITKANLQKADDDFAKNIDHIMEVQQQALERTSDTHTSVKFTQMQSSFSVTKSGLFGLTALGASSNTTLFWNKKKVPAATPDEAKTFIMNEQDDLGLEMKVDEISDFLVSSGKVKDQSKLRDNLDEVIRKANKLFHEMENLESPNWWVGGYRLDLEVTASGQVYPFTKVGENVRLWLEWTKPAPTAKKAIANTKVTRFVSNVLADIEQATTKVQIPKFDLASLYVGLGADYKAGFFGFGASQFGFVGYVRFAHKPKPQAPMNTMIPDDADYSVVHDGSDAKSSLVTISRQKIRNGIENSLKYAQFFARKAEDAETTHWEVGTIREIATITHSGLFGLSTLNSKNVFTFMFNRQKPQAVAKSMELSNPLGQLTLIRLSFVTQLGYAIPEIANFEVRPNIEYFWK